VTVPEATTHQLRSYIALGCPTTRTRYDGPESPLRIEFGFTLYWYHERLKIDFGRGRIFVAKDAPHLVECVGPQLSISLLMD
jgi:hypothetical protein